MRNGSADEFPHITVSPIILVRLCRPCRRAVFPSFSWQPTEEVHYFGICTCGCPRIQLCTLGHRCLLLIQQALQQALYLEA